MFTIYTYYHYNYSQLKASSECLLASTAITTTLFVLLASLAAILLMLGASKYKLL